MTILIIIIFATFSIITITDDRHDDDVINGNNFNNVNDNDYI